MLDSHAYGAIRTHEPALVSAVAAARSGAVLELGAGDYSTPLLHALCAAMGRELVTIDNNESWVEKFVPLSTATHQVLAVRQWDDAFSLVDARTWAVVFVDHAPADRRVVDIARLADRTEFMVVHDSEDALYGYESAFARFAYRYDYKRLVPCTSILSNVRPFPAEL